MQRIKIHEIFSLTVRPAQERLFSEVEPGKIEFAGLEILLVDGGRALDGDVALDEVMPL